MNELLFEAYRVQSVNYGLDALFSAYANHIRDNGLIVSSGRTTTTVIPLVNGRGFLDNAKRLSWGGIPATDFLLRLMQLKYPNCPQRMTPYEVQCMLEELCYTCLLYTSPSPRDRG